MADEQVTYAQAGVDIEEGARAVDAIKDVVHSTYRPEVVGDIGGFGGLFSLAAAKEMDDPLLVSGTDGVGTKLKLAQLVGRHDTVGIDLVAMCANDILATGAEPLFFLDYVAVGKLDAEAMAKIVGGIGEGCRQAGCALIGGEMAEHPGVMDPDDYDLSGFCVGLVDRPKMLDPQAVREGDVLVGLASSGLHSNGYSLARPLFFLDYVAVGKLDAEAMAKIVGGIGEGCRQAGCALIGGEMAEHPGVMDPDDYDLSGFCVGLVDRPKMLDPQAVREGDVLVGLASSGLHSNGYSLARKVCVEGLTAEEAQAPVEALGGQSVADALLTPTRIYVKPVRAVMEGCPGAVRALAHITGGGITENLNRALPAGCDAVVELGAWPVPPVVRYVCDAAHLAEDEALKTFNMGLGLVLIVDPERVDEVCAALAAAGEEPRRVGRVTAGTGVVRYENEGSLYGA